MGANQLTLPACEARNIGLRSIQRTGQFQRRKPEFKTFGTCEDLHRDTQQTPAGFTRGVRETGHGRAGLLQAQPLADAQQRIQGRQQLLFGGLCLRRWRYHDSGLCAALLQRQTGQVAVLLKVALTQIDGITQGAGVAQIGGCQKGFGIVQIAEGADQQPRILLFLGQLCHQLANGCQRHTPGMGLQRQMAALQRRLQAVGRYTGTQALDDLVEVLAGRGGCSLCHGED